MRGGVGYKDARMCRRVERDSDAPRRATGGAVEQSGLIEACITPPSQQPGWTPAIGALPSGFHESV
jgi:hypothetical protein